MNLDLPENYNPRQIDPALLTFREWLKIVDPSCKTHPSSAYDEDVSRFNQSDYQKKSTFPKLLRQLTINGIKFEIRLKIEKIGQRVKLDDKGDVLRVDGEVQYYTDDELKRLGKRMYEWSIGAFDGDTMVGSVQDEWGCMLVMVAREYRSFGLGRILLKIGYGIEPEKPSGGFTVAGMHTFARIHAEFVHDALQSGLYTKLVKNHQITVARAKEIIASAMAASKEKRSEINLKSDDPKDWVLFVGDNGDFIMYDKKLREALKGGDQMEYFKERMIKGIIYVLQMGHRNVAFPKVFGGDNPNIRRFLMACGIEYARRENDEFYVEGDDAQAVAPAMGKLEPPNNVIGFTSQKVIPTGKEFDYDGMGRYERAWRRTFDRYDEFKNEMMEMAYAKYR